MKESKCRCGAPALYSIAITNLKTGELVIIDYCIQCMPKILVERMKRR